MSTARRALIPKHPRSLTTGALFRPDILIAAGAAGRRNHRRVAGIRGRCAHFRVDARRRAQDAVGFGKLVAELLTGLPGR